MADDKETPVIHIGGDASGAQNALREVQNSLRQLGDTVKGVGSTLKHFFAFEAIKEAFKITFEAIKFGFESLKRVIEKVADVLKESYRAWTDEAKAQAKIDSLLRGNVKNYRAAGTEIQRIVKSMERATSLSKSDVRGVFGAFLQIRHGAGLGEAKQLLPGIADLSAARGYDPEQLAQMFARALETGQTMMLKRMGIVLDQKQFKRDPIGTITGYVNQVAPGAAGAIAAMDPIAQLKKGIGGIYEAIGKPLAEKLNPIFERVKNAAFNFADKLEEMSLKEIWQTFKELAADAWNYVRLYAVTTFEWLKMKWPEIKQPIIDAVTSGVKSMADVLKETLTGENLVGQIAVAVASGVWHGLSGKAKSNFQYNTNPSNFAPGSAGQRRAQAWKWIMPSAPAAAPQAAPGPTATGLQPHNSAAGGAKPVSAAGYYGKRTSAAVNAALAADPSGMSNASGIFHLASSVGGAAPAQPTFNQMLQANAPGILGHGINEGPLANLMKPGGPKPTIDEKLAILNDPTYWRTSPGDYQYSHLDGVRGIREGSTLPGQGRIHGRGPTFESENSIVRALMNRAANMEYPKDMTASRLADALSSDRRRGALMPAF